MLARRGRAARELTLPVVVLVLATVATFVAAALTGATINTANGSDIGTVFADLGPITLAIGLSMLVAEFDLSAPAMYVLGGTLAVKYGQDSPLLGVLIALGAGLALGAFQGGIIARLGLSSVPVTLGGFLIAGGTAYLLTGGDNLAYDNYAVGDRLSAPILEVLSLRSVIAIGAFVLIGLLLAATRLGPQTRAVGGDRRAARVAGVPVSGVLVGVFATAGVLSSVSGALLSYQLAYTEPTIQFSPLVFGVTASVLGGISLLGGRGNVLGIALGTIALGIVQEGLVIVAASDAMSNIVTGGLLGLVALFAAPEFRIMRLRVTGEPATGPAG
jgi:ribose transport system permease protein